MMTIFRFAIRVAFVLLFMSLVVKGSPLSGLIFVFYAWVVVRAAPGMWRDFQGLWFIGKKYGREGFGRFGHKSNFYM